MTNKGKEPFLNYYRSIFGDRTNALMEALAMHVNPALLLRPDHQVKLEEVWVEKGYDWKPISWFKGAVVWPENVAFGAVLPGSRESWIYPLASSSLMPVAMLDISPTDLVLDTCAAPGGKALASAGFLENPALQLTVNDVSVDRVIRLRRVLRSFGYEEVSVLRGPADYLGRHYPQSYDRILADVPCSTEAHVWKSREHLAEWSLKRVVKLRERQINIVAGIAAALKPGGRLVYATCSLTPEENESVVQEILEHKELGLTLTAGWQQDLPGGPGLPGYGYDPSLVRRVWPDIHHQDPMFAAAFEKVC